MKSSRFQFFVSFYVLFLFHASAAVHYVNVKNTSPASPYTSWATAATNIQNAVDASMDGDLILVTNGVYQSAGRVAPDGSPTDVVVTHAVAMHSVNGATVTLIDGGGTNRCVYLTNGTTLYRRV
jgi:hypothetical protein